MITLGWLCCCLSFSLLRAAIACIRGARSSSGVRTLLQDSTSNGPCKGGGSVNELMYNVLFDLFFIIRAGITNDGHLVFFGV